MSENRKVTEPHGCIVCGKVYSMLVVYSPSGQLVDCTVTSSSAGRRVYDARRPLVACTTHSTAEVEAALTKRYPGLEKDKKDDEDDE
jgi:hypothetical protein